MASAFQSISTFLAFSLCYALLVSSLPSSLSSTNNVTNDSSLSYLPASDPLLQYVLGRSGYILLPDNGARLFYYFFEERSRVISPVMLWLTGVPGTTCSIALFRENGPFRIKQDLFLESNDYGWDKEFKMIYVDEPRGTGFSYINPDSDIRRDEDGIVEDLYNFLVTFLHVHHRGLIHNDFYIAGQSYAGKYGPALANRIHRGNKENPNYFIKLKGVAIGNGFTNPSKQLSTTLEYSEPVNRKNSLIKDEDRGTINTLSETCISSADSCDANLDQYKCEVAYDNCGTLIQAIAQSKGRNIYDVRKTHSAGALNYDFSNVRALLNEELVKRHLGVGTNSFELSNYAIDNAMRGYYMKNGENEVLSLLNQGTNLLIYAGEYDLLCNAHGNLKWVKEFVWEENTYLLSSELKYVLFIFNQALAGKWRLYKHFAFLEVKNAGHMVAMDQPKVAFEMIRKWKHYVNGHPIVS